MQFSLKYSPLTSNKNKHRPSESSRNFLPSNWWSHTTYTIGLVAVFIVILGSFPNSAEGYNDEKGILKWNPYWFTNFRYSAPSSFYISPTRIGNPNKRLSDNMFNAGSSSSFTSGGGGSGGVGGGFYKWSPVYFSGGVAPSQPSSYYGSSGSMYSSSRPRWSLSDYGGSRFLTRYYGGNSYAPQVTKESAGIADLATGNNDLSALLGDEILNSGLGLENDDVGILDGEREEISEKKHR